MLETMIQKEGRLTLLFQRGDWTSIKSLANIHVLSFYTDCHEPTKVHVYHRIWMISISYKFVRWSSSTRGTVKKGAPRPATPDVLYIQLLDFRCKDCDVVKSMTWHSEGSFCYNSRPTLTRRERQLAKGWECCGSWENSARPEFMITKEKMRQT